MSEGKQVHVSWRWIVVFIFPILISVISWLAVADRARFEQTDNEFREQLKIHSQLIQQLLIQQAAQPNKEDLKDLREAIKELNIKIDSVRFAPGRVP